MRYPPDFECKLDRDDWSKSCEIIGVWTYEIAARCFAEDNVTIEYMSDLPETFIVDVRMTDTPHIVKRFSVTAEPRINLSSEEITVARSLEGTT